VGDNERIRAELELENSAFMSALHAASQEESLFIGYLNLFGESAKTATTHTDSLTASLSRMKVEEIQLAPIMKAAEDETDAVTHAMRELEAQTVRSTEATNRKSAAVDNSTKSARSYQMGMQQASYALSDFFSAQGDMGQKFNGIANNLQMVAMSMGAGGVWFLAITGAITLVQVLTRNWGAFSEAIAGTDTTAAEAAINKVTAALDKQNAALQKASETKKRSDEQKAAGREFVKAIGAFAGGGKGGDEVIMEQMQAMGWDQDLINKKMVEGQQGDSDAVEWFRDVIGTDPRSRTNKTLGNFGVKLAGIQGRAADKKRVDAIEKEGAEGERMMKQQRAAAFYGDQAAEEAGEKRTQTAADRFAEQQAKQREARGERDARRSEGFDKRAARIREDVNAGEEVQAEAANQGIQLDLKTAVQMARQRKQELQRMQGEVMSTIVGTQADFMAELAMMRKQLAATRAYQQQNRTAQMMGGN
jgi:hypothetical protein